MQAQALGKYSGKTSNTSIDKSQFANLFREDSAFKLGGQPQKACPIGRPDLRDCHRIRSGCASMLLDCLVDLLFGITLFQRLALLVIFLALGQRHGALDQVL